MILRDYQNEAIESSFEAFRHKKSTLISAPVGSGKTIIQAGFISRVIDECSSARFMSLVHTRELVEQNALAMRVLRPNASIGVNSASLNRRDTSSQIIFASIQSVARNAKQFGKMDAIIVDEAHLIPSSSDSMYQKFLSKMSEANPDIRILGMSGTPFRLDSGWLHRGPNAFFDSMCFEIGISELIDRGHLVPPISMKMKNRYNVDGVHVRGGDYIAKELQARVSDFEKTALIAKEATEIGLSENRKSWVCFCAGVDHAIAARNAFRALGITCETIEGNMDSASRARILSEFKEGKIQCLTNVNICSIGFNHPPIDMLIMMRPTKSAALYIQQVGRGLRTYPGKNNVIVLDFANVVSTLGPVDSPIIKDGGSGEKAVMQSPPLKECPDCSTLNKIGVKNCIHCDYEFPVRNVEDKLAIVASSANILSIRQPAKSIGPNDSPYDDWLQVTTATAKPHTSQAGKLSMRIEYQCGPILIHKEWIALGQGGYAHQKAMQWWESLINTRCPATVQEGVARFAKEHAICAIRVIPDGKFIKVIGWRRKFGDEKVIEYDRHMRSRVVVIGKQAKAS